MNELVQQLVEALGIDVAQAGEELKEYQARYPDQAERIAAVEAFIRAHATPEVIAALPATVAGIAKDIATGQTGVDPGAWAGSG